MAETLGEWQWRGTAERLTLKLDQESSYLDLQGEWGLAEFGVLLNGLSRRQLERIFSHATGVVRCALTLANGQTLHLVGAFDQSGDAQGLILTDTLAPSENTSPGPDLVPVFQPIISLQTGRVAGFEALARWPSSTDDTVNRYVDDALASNMMIHACQALTKWRQISGFEDLFVQVNLTARDLTDDKLIDLVAALIDGYGLKDGDMRLELTEQAALRDIEKAIDIAQRLQKVGAGLVLDDFGTGHSSFLWLAKLPANSLKIDFDLVSKIEDPRVRTILEALTLMARRLGMRATAEGVEDRSVLPVLQDIGFDYAQGFALGRPMQASTAEDYLRNDS